ncbi:MAG: hypothetical protein IJD39_02200 [Clostridia bacterium]|nr:hypothetical protein [Clostridia bacterium]
MKKGLIWLLLITLILPCLPAQADTIIDIPYTRYETSDQIATVVVTDEVINDVKAGIFGGNTSYRGGGYGIYNEEDRVFNETMLQLLRDSGVTAVRLPGGIEGDYFHWHESVGPVENRIAQIDPFSRDYPTYTLKDGAPYVVGFGPDEWFELCRLTDTALAVQLNAGNGTPQEAVDFIRYCLDSGVRIDDIAVGNEVCMAEERVEGIRVTKTPEEYVAFYNQVWDLMSDEMKQELKDRNIPFGCIGIPMSHPLCKYKEWDKTVLAALKDKSDFIDIHIGYSPLYVSGQNNEQIIKCLLASADRVRKHLDVEISTIEKHAPEMKIAISEHAPLGATPYTSGVAGGMYLASFFQVVLAEEKVISTDYLPMTNHPASNNLLGYYNELGENISWDNVVSMVFRMYSDQIGRDVLSTQVTGAKTFASTGVGLVPATRGVSEGAAAVYLDRETKEGTLFVLNKAYKENTVFDITLPFEKMEITAVTELFTPNNTMYNNHARPTMVKPTLYPDACGPVEGGHLTVTAKPVSLLKIDFKIANP